MDLWIFTCVNEVGKFLVYFDGGVDGVGCRDPNCLFKDRVCFYKQELMEPHMGQILQDGENVCFMSNFL